MIITCPCCSQRYPLDAALQDESGRKLMILLAKATPEFATSLVMYMALFQSKSKALGWDRSLRLANEVLQLSEDLPTLTAALTDATLALREKQASGDWSPMKNHNYLKKVLSSTTARTNNINTALITTEKKSARSTQGSKTAQGFNALEGLIREQ